MLRPCKTGHVRMGQETFLGLDIGTSSVKALLIDGDQRTVAEATAALDVSRPQPLWSEQNPEDWIEGVEAAVHTVRRRAPEAFARLAGIGLSGQMHGATFLDGADRPVAAGDPVERRPLFRRMRGADPPRPRFLTTRRQSRHARLHRAKGDVGRQARAARCSPRPRRILLPKDYVRLRLTGEAVCEMSDAAGTLWLDIAGRRWDETLIAASGLKLSHMPALVEGSAVSAYLSPEIAAAWGLAGRKIPIAGGGGDNAASAVGVGADRAGRGVCLARHLGRRVLRHRQICEPARAHAARLLPRAARALARHVGDAVGGGGADLGRRNCSAAATRSAPASTPPKRFARDPAARPRRRRSSCPISPASARRTTTPKRPACSRG